MKYTTTALALFLAAGSAAAEGLDYVSLGLTHTKIDGFRRDIETTNLNGAFEYSTNQFVFMGSFDSYRIDAGLRTNDRSRVDARVGYEVMPGALAYVGIGSVEFLFSRTTRPATYYEAGAQYGNDMFEVGLHYTNLEEPQIETYTLAGAYNVTPESEVGFAVTDVKDDPSSRVWMLFGSYDNGPLSVTGSLQSRPETDLNVFALDASYEFGGQYRATAGLMVRETPFDTVRGASVSAGYAISEDLWFDVSYSTLESRRPAGEVLGVMLTYEFGERSLLVDRVNEIRRDATSNYGVFGIRTPVVDLLGGRAL